MVGNLFKLNRLSLFALLVCILMVFNPIYVMAEKQLVIDEAGLLTQPQIEELNAKANALSEEYSMDIVITTTNDTGGKSSREYADDYFDYNGFGVGPEYDGILFLIDMDNREAYISTTGIGIKYLTDERIERVLDEVFDSGLVDGDFYGASLGFLNGTERYLEAGIPHNQHTVEEKINKITLFDMIIALIGSLVVGGIFVGSVKTSYKLRNPGNPFSYRNNSIVNIANTEDRLVDTFVTHRIIPKPKPSSGGGSSGGRSTTHRSSSGRSHGGGGRKF